jgi:hypothetical protein
MNRYTRITAPCELFFGLGNSFSRGLVVKYVSVAGTLAVQLMKQPDFRRVQAGMIGGSRFDMWNVGLNIIT